jgi:hypothetical protein
MRAGPLSDDRVIALLNARFVPVYVSNEDYDKDGAAPLEEKKERNRIWHEAAEKKLSSGTVHVYLLSPGDHRVLDSMHVADASETKKLLAMLNRTVANLKTPAGEPVVKPALQSRAPRSEGDSLVLHGTARGFNQGSWREFPGENWLVLSAEEWRKLLPAKDATVEESRAVDEKLTARLLANFYPQTENNDTSSMKIERRQLEARLIAADAKLVRWRLSGQLQARHAFYPGRTDHQPLTAQLVGYVDVDPQTQTIRALNLVTQTARYGQEEFGAALRLAR